MTCGIYEIVNKVNGKRYVGSSVNIESMWRAHLCLLRANRHHSIYLQRAWNKYGHENLIFNILEMCTEEEILEREQIHIDQSSEYNIMRVAGRNNGYRHTDETRSKMSEAQAAIWTAERRAAVSAKSLETWARKDVIDKVMSVRSSEEYRSAQSIRTRELWLDSYYKERTLAGISSKERREKLSESLRCKKTHEFYHPHHGHVVCTQWDLRNMFPELSRSCISQVCSGKQLKHKGWTLKKAP